MNESPVFSRTLDDTPRQMRSLDLAEGPEPAASAASDLPQVPVPVVVERVEPETRRPWLWWY